MAVEVPCPNCRSILRAPENAAGKRVRCKKCEHRFHIPGAAPVPASVGDSQMLSVVDAPSLPPAPASNAFEFDSGPSVIADDGPRRPRRESKGSNLVLILLAIGFVLLLGCGGVAVGVYVLIAREVKTITSAVTQTLGTESKPTTSSPPKTETKEKPPDRETPKTTPSAKGVRKGKDAEPPSAPAIGAAVLLPSPPTGVTTLVAKPKVKLTLDGPATAVRGVRFAEGTVPTAAVLWKSFAGFQGTGAKDTLDLYSTATMRRYERLEIPADGIGDSRPFDVSKDGQRVAIEQPAGKLTVYDTESKEKVIDGAALFDGPVVAMRFLNPDKLLVFDRAGALHLWDIPQKKEVTSGPQFGPNGAKDPMAVVSEVCGDRIFVGVPGMVVAVGVGTGQKIGQPMALPGLNWVPLGLAVDPQARQVVVAYRPLGATTQGLCLFPAEGGKGVVAQMTLPESAGVPVAVAFATDQIVTVHTENHAAAFIYDLENRVMMAYARSTGEPALQFADPHGGRYWWLTGEGKASFAGVELPFDAYFELVNAAKGDKKPVYLSPRADGLAKGQ